MKNMAARYGRTILIALDPKTYKQEYYKKLYTLKYNGLHGKIEYKNKPESEDQLIPQTKQHFGHFYPLQTKKPPIQVGRKCFAFLGMNLDLPSLALNKYK
jgi:hypothetical protein